LVLVLYCNVILMGVIACWSETYKMKETEVQTGANYQMSTTVAHVCVIITQQSSANKL